MFRHTFIGNTHTIIFGRFAADGTSPPLLTVNDGTDNWRGQEAVVFGNSWRLIVACFAMEMQA